MQPKIYTSTFPSVPIVNTSIFTHLFAADPNSPTTVGGYPGSDPAFIDATTGTTLSRSQLKHLALTFGYGLLHHPSLPPLKRGDTVLVYSPNSLAWPVVLFGCVAAGLRCTPANSGYTSRELGYQYIDSGAKVVLTSEEGLETVKEMFRDLGEDGKRKIAVLGSGLGWAGGPDGAGSQAGGLLRLQDLLAMGTLPEEAKFTGNQVHETIYICYSSGTTGKAKGVETTHNNITTVLDIAGPLFPMVHGIDKMLGVLPFFHIYGAVELLHFPFSYGVPVIIQTRFEPVQFCSNIQRYGITTALVVPPVLVVLCRHNAVDEYDLSTLTKIFSAAAPLGTGLIHQVTERLMSKRKSSKGPRVNVAQGYGLTETSPVSHFLPFPDSLRKAGSVGLLLPNLQARIVLDVDGNVTDVAEGEPGELWVKGPTVMKGYLNNPTATADTVTSDGWLRTGDVVVRDKEGYYWIVDRRKELIKYKGFQVPPSELESVLLTHPDIADVAVIGVDDLNEATELPRAYVVHANPANVKTQEERGAFGHSVRKWTESKVAHHKYLRGGVVVIDAIPKSAAGKILRRELRDRAKEELLHETVKAKL